MANYKDNNADLGNQTIEGTVSPYELDAEIVMPDGSTQPIRQPDNTDDQPVIIMAEPVDSAEPIEAIVTPPVADEAKPDDPLAGLFDDEQPSQPTEAPAEPIITAEPAQQSAPVTDEAADLDAMLAAMLEGDDQPTEAPAEPIITAEPAQQGAPVADEAADLDAMLAAMLAGDDQPTEAPAEPIIAVEPVTPAEQQQTPEQKPADNSQNDAAREMLEQAQAIMEQARQAQLQAEMAQAHAQAQAAQAQAAQAQRQPYMEDKAAEAARSMMQQAQMMMQQAQAAQLQAQQAAQQAQLHAQQAAAQPTRRNDETEAARLMMEQANRLMEQAQAAQFRTTAPTTDPYAMKEVDRLKNELDGMRELVNKLTFAMSQSANNNVQASQPLYGYNPDRDQYKRLETELDQMRRDIKEKDLRDREKELDRRQKEAENVRDIRPEMMQVSDSRDMMPVAQPQQNIGNEYIPIANGVYYSTKDKQVYVMTPASGAAAANPTIERPKTAAKRPAARAARPRPRPAGRRRPMSGARRRPGPRRPHR